MDPTYWPDRYGDPDTYYDEEDLERRQELADTKADRERDER